MAKKMVAEQSERKTEVEVQEALPPQTPLTLNELFNFLDGRGATKAQITRLTGPGPHNMTLAPQSNGNMILVIEVDTTKGTVV